MLVIASHFTRYAQGFLTPSQTAEVTAQMLWDMFFVHYGSPEKFLSD